MQSHGPKRVYSQGSLEFWFERLDEGWEARFAAEHLELGRSYYREGEIREVELGPNDAIIHCKFDRKEEYSVLEWNGRELSVRSSTHDRSRANAMAVAGLYEIEELIADEISALPVDLKAPAAGPEPASQESPTEPAPPPGAKQAAAAEGRELVVRFEAGPAGLVCRAFWKERGRLIQALSNGTPAPSPVTAAERIQLITLAAEARKAHFQFSQETGGYLLSEVSEIPHFVGRVLPAWSGRFRIERDASVERLAGNARNVRIEARARRREGNRFDLEWIFRAGERMLSRSEVEDLMRRDGGPALLPDIGIVTASPEALKAAREWEATAAEAARSGDGDLPAYMLFSLFSDRRCEVALSPELQLWRDSLVNPQPAGYALLENLRPYQRAGVEWLAHLCDHGCHGLLADEMGLGKTLQAIALIAARPLAGKVHLVVCPASVVPVWEEELRRFAPSLRARVLRQGEEFNRSSGVDVWLASYTQLRKRRAQLDDVEFGYAILDESQYIKNPDAKVTAACFSIHARHRIALTGTPLENRQLDLWSLFRFLLPGLLGTRLSFEQALAKDRDGTVNRLRAQVVPFILRRTKDQVARELPQKTEMDLLCPLTDLQKREYARVCAEGLARLGPDLGEALRDRSFGLLSLLTRLRQIACDPDLVPWLRADLAESGKLNLLAEKLTELLASGHKVVVFSQFVMLLNRVRLLLERQFPDVARFEITGSTIDRLKPVQSFQAANGAAVMLASLRAAGTGITLHAADYVFLLDPWWNPAVEEQAVDRVHRIGQTRNVFVYRMVTAGTVEERIEALKADKKELFRRVVEGSEPGMTLADRFGSLVELIELRTEAGE
jgi:superfamily II DNA or RNA helicase